MTVQETKDLVQVALGVVSLVGVLSAAFTWANLRGRKLIHKQIEAIRNEISPNGGKSLNDAIKRIETKVDRMKDGLHFVIALSEEPVWECDPAGECKWASPALCAMFGLSHQEMLGWGWLSAIATQDERHKTAEAWNDAVTRMIPYTQTYTIHNRVSGERSVVEARGFPSNGDDGRAVWYYGTVNKLHPFKTRQTVVDTAIPGMKGAINE